MKYQRKVCSFEFIYYICNIINAIESIVMGKNNWLYKAFTLYRDGFRQMTLGRTLWAIILIKLFIIFAILKVFFFPDYISTHADEGKESDFVATKILKQ